MNDDIIQPELKDIFENLNRYTASNKNNVIFIGGILGFTKGTCEGCGDHEGDVVDDNKSRLFAFGNKETLRILLNDLRDIIEDSCDEEGFVNL